jgi:hypothetical protein
LMQNGQVPDERSFVGWHEEILGIEFL